LTSESVTCWGATKGKFNDILHYDKGEGIFFLCEWNTATDKDHIKRVLYSLFGVSSKGIVVLEDQKVPFCSIYSVLIFIPCIFCFDHVMASESFSSVCNFNVNCGKKVGESKPKP